MLRMESTGAANLVLLAGGAEPEDQLSFEDLIGQAYKELEVSRRRAQMVLANARLEANEICQRARTEADRMLEEARVQAETEAQARRHELEEEVRARAWAEGVSGAEKATRGALLRAAQLKDRIESAYRDHLREAESEILETVMAIAQRVVGLEQEEFREALGAAVLGVLQDRASAREVSLFINPADYDALMGFLSEHSEPFERLGAVVGSAGVPEGCCKFRSPELNLDLSLDRRLEQVRQHLRQQWALAAPCRQE